MKYLFRKEEIIAVEDKFCDDLLFEALSTPCKAIKNEARTFALQPGELYYNVLFNIDDMKTKGILEYQRYCNKALWDDMLSDFLDKADDVDREEVERSVGIVMFATATVLIRSGLPKYTSIASVLIRRTEEHLPDFCDILQRKFESGFSIIDKVAIQKSIADYLESERNISAEIEQTWDELVYSSTPSAQHDDIDEYDVPQLKIASGKKTSMIIVLEAMYKAGWIVDANGRALTNRDEAINYIMDKVFGEPVNNIAQLVNAAKDPTRNKDGIEKYFNELISASKKK